jgi:myo-inositol 2-dehydrogenase / D-chiro-inositol 1-dehydrogenase
MNKLKVGVIGTGRIGKVHIESLVTRIAETEVVSIADVNLDQAKKVAAQFNIQNVTSSCSELINNPDVEAVIICSSTDTHTPLIKEAAAAGKHIFCEKPIDLSLENIYAALEAVEKAGVKMMLGFNRRFDPNFSKIHTMVKEGQIGDPHVLKITSRDPEPPPGEYAMVSGGIFVDMVIHDFDMARYIVGSEVTEIFTKANVLVDPEIGKAGDFDTAVSTLYFENGAIGVIDNSRKAVYGYDQRLEIFGSKGMVNADNNTPDRDLFFNKEGIHASLPLHFFMERYTESYVREVKAFVDSVRNDAPLPVSGEDGLKSMLIAIAARKSALENRPVKISEVA